MVVVVGVVIIIFLLGTFIFIITVMVYNFLILKTEINFTE